MTLQKATADDVKLTITHVQPHVASGVPIGPFLVPGALTQGGEILVAVAADLLQPAAGRRRREAAVPGHRSCNPDRK